MPTLDLIDGYAQFFRHYHAIRTPMTSPVTKEPTNMTFGFVGLLLKILRGEAGGRPDYFAVALDVSGDRGTFRSQLYPEYKATRDAPPEDLRPQVDRCLSILELIGVPVLGAEGFEADDVIATIVRSIRESTPDSLVRIITKDKDLKQLLVEGRVELYDAHKDERITEASLKDDTGITPAQVVDMLTLMGDTVDNVPGVEGIGPKTAAQLIAQHGSLDEVLAHADEIKGKRGEKLREAAPRLELSRTLVTLRDDVPLEFDIGRTRVENLDLAPLLPVLRELGFGRYQTELRAMLGVGDEAGAPHAPAEPASASTGDGGLFAHLDAAPQRETDADYRCVRTKKELAELVGVLEAAPEFAVDTETTSLRPMEADLCGLSFATEPGAGWYVPVRSPEPGSHLDERTVLDALRPLLEDESKPKIGHNLKYDLLVLRRAGVELRGLDREPSCDTMVASYVIDASRSSHKLDSLALALLDHATIPISELIGSGKNQKRFDEVPLDAAVPYAAEDADISLRLARAMRPQIESHGLQKLFYELEMPLVPVLAELEWNGILVDPDELDTQRERLESQISDLRSQIEDRAHEATGRGFDPDSPKQLSGILFNAPDAEDPGLGLKPVKRTKTGFSTDVEVLTKLTDDPGVETEIPRLILDYRRLTKLVSTYLVALKEAINPETKRVHASFNQTVAVTGRLSSSDPNLQNIPIRTEVGREIRKAFVAPPGRVLISADYSQIELRLLAHLSRDPALIAAFHAGEDIHRAVAAEVHGIKPEDVTPEQRSGAKMVNFGIVYGVTPFGLARRLGITNTEAGAIIDGYKQRFAGITTFLAECVAQAHEQGYVETMMGRRRPIPDIDSNNPQRRALAERTAINTVVQGSAADLIKLAMVDLHWGTGRRARAGNGQWAMGNGEEGSRSERSPERERRVSGAPGDEPSLAHGPLSGVRMLLQIHDELVFEAAEGNAEAARGVIVERMEHAMELSVPLVVDSSISTDWFEGK